MMRRERKKEREERVRDKEGVYEREKEGVHDCVCKDTEKVV